MPHCGSSGMILAKFNFDVDEYTPIKPEDKKLNNFD